MGVGLGIAALVLASLIAWKRIGPDWLADRLAAVIALCGVQSIVAGTKLGGKLRGWGQKAADWLGELAGRLDPGLHKPVATWTIPVIVGVMGLLWVAAMLPAMLSRWIGGIANESHTAGTIWGGALVLGVFASSGPGAWGNFLLALVDQLGATGDSLVRGVLA
jgi:hypothetical protein